MIIKCLSRKSNLDQLIKYVLAAEKTKEKDSGTIRRISKSNEISSQDQKHLEAERFDAQLMAELKQFKGNIKDFISELTRGKPTKQIEMEPAVFKHNIRTNSIKGYIKEFEANERLRTYRRKDNVLAYHTVVSFSKKDTEHLSDTALKDIMNHYVTLRGEESLYLGAIHKDKDHIHAHIIMSGVQYLTGKANRISRQEFQGLKISMQEYQKTKYPQLKHSLPEHGKSSEQTLQEKDLQKNLKTLERSSDKASLLKLLETTYNNSNSVEQFLSQVSLLGHTPYYRNGKLQGIKYKNERKFRLKFLGYDTEKFEELNQRSQQLENNLRDIADLRNRGYKRDISKSNEPSQTLAGSLTDLDELAALRGHAAKILEQVDLDRERADDLQSDAQDRDNDFDDRDTDTDDSLKESDNQQDEENESSEDDTVQSESDNDDTEQIE